MDADPGNVTGENAMDFTHRTGSPLGPLLLASDGEALVGLWFEGQKRFAAGLAADAREARLPVFDQAEEWLSQYFSGRAPDFTPPLAPRGTAFARAVWRELMTVPFGATVTYGELARRLSASPRAVGGAVGRNPISLIIPCHRVIGADGRLTGYAGGLERKERLLALEKRPWTD